MVSILVAGDTCPIERNEPLFRAGDAPALLGNLQAEVAAANLVIANLECPLISRQTPIVKTGRNLGASIECARGLAAIGVDVAALANNHIMDHGPQGLRSTLDALSDHGIAYVGAGKTIADARRIVVRTIRGVRIGIVAVAEHEFSMANETHAGANPLDIIDYVRNVREHRAVYDKLLVLVHGGNEHYPYPRPGLIETCRFMVEEGASAVICQHSHCVGCMETYRDAPIVYGQGNFLFDKTGGPRTWYVGCLVQLTVDRNAPLKARLIPFYQAKEGPGARRMSAEDDAIWAAALAERSRRLGDAQAVKEKWDAFCRQRKCAYLHAIHGRRSLLRRIAGRLDLLHLLDSSRKQRVRLNIIRCESHREALVNILQSESIRRIDNARV